MNELTKIEGNELTETEDMAQSFLPYYYEGGKVARYLGYIISGFSIREASRLAKVTEKTIHNWRRDPNFLRMEEKAKYELREELSNRLLDIEFTRNFRIILAKDFEVLFKDAQGFMLTDKEEQYLLTIRKFYTPQQLAMIKQLVGDGGKSGEPFDFTKTVLTIRLEKEERSNVLR